MKVLIATPYFWPRVGGMENYARFLARSLHEAGVEVVVVCGDTTVTVPTRTEADGHPVWRLPVGKVVSNTPVNLAWPWMLRRIIRAERPDIINAHTPVPFMVDAVTLVAGRTPVMVTYHAATLFKPNNLAMRVVTRLYGLAQYMTLRRARTIIAVSDYVKQALSQWQAKTVVITNAVTAVAPARRQPGTGLVFVNNLEPTHRWKGLDLILDSLALLAGRGLIVSLTVIGDGADRARYEARVQELGLGSSVRFMGVLVGAERDAVVRQTAALMLYSTTANDAFPTVMLEAWAQGLAVIAAAIGPMPSLIEAGQTGVLVRPNDAAALADAIAQAMADGRGLQVMGERGRQLVEREYTWDRKAQQTKALLEGLA